MPTSAPSGEFDHPAPDRVQDVDPAAVGGDGDVAGASERPGRAVGPADLAHEGAFQGHGLDPPEVAVRDVGETVGTDRQSGDVEELTGAAAVRSPLVLGRDRDDPDLVLPAWRRTGARLWARCEVGTGNGEDKAGGEGHEDAVPATLRHLDHPF